ncbi:MAG: PD-(D/E)XK nuclease family protein [Acidobacterium ailaaui]|nr:PD-(D/E)XK nuclease family protein [Pseudacidobacterium ailaaui]
MTTEIEPVTYRSVSQIKEYLECGWRYKLSRRDGAWKRPAAWLPHGTAVHAAAEAWERSGRTMTVDEVQDVFRREYAAAVNQYLEITPNVHEWFASGRYRGEEDIARRHRIGLDQVTSYIRYYRDHPTEMIWRTPDGTPAIELRVTAEIAGVPMLGIIDQVVSVPAVPKPRPRSKAAAAISEQTAAGALPRLRVRDIKTGTQPGDAWQLKVYALILQALYGIEITEGDYWMAKTGKPTKIYDLGATRSAEVGQTIAMANEGILAEDFHPNPGDACKRCPVATACKYRFS